MPAPMGHPPYNVNGEGGRPPTYDDAFIEKQADAFSKWLKYPNNVFFNDFVLDQDILPEHLSRWADRNERFRQVYELAKYKQESKLKNGSLTKVFDGGFVKFLLSNKHGMQHYAEKQETKVSGDQKNPIAIAIEQAMGQSKDLVEDGQEPQ